MIVSLLFLRDIMMLHRSSDPPIREYRVGLEQVLTLTFFK